jgi:hypothetical protein
MNLGLGTQKLFDEEIVNIYSDTMRYIDVLRKGYGMHSARVYKNSCSYTLYTFLAMTWNIDFFLYQPWTILNKWK